jgi:ribosomal protein S18 acetylase RimI-like enzyme
VDAGVERIELNGGQDFLEWRRGSGNTIEIYDIVVNSERRTGKGRLMLSMLLRAVRPQDATVFAITRTENKIAQDFYLACGFHVTGALYEFYDAGCGRVDALMFGRKAAGRV